MTNDPILSRDDIGELIESVKADREARQVFLAMPREEQLLAILGMIAFTNSQVAQLSKRLAENEENSKVYRLEREKKEKEIGDLAMTTGTKIAMGIRQELEKRFDFWVYLRDKVIPGILQLIIIAILVLAFSPK